MPSHKFHVDNTPVISLLKKVKRGEIDLNPDYQRGVVWSTEQQQSLIETLLSALPTPGIYLVELPYSATKDGAKEKWESLDGKNRITAMYKFYNNELLVNGSKFNGLNEVEKELFEDTQIQCCTFRWDAFKNEDEKEDYFRKLQQGKAMTTNEKIHSYTTTPVIRMCNTIYQRHTDLIKSITDTDKYQHIPVLMNIIHVINTNQSKPNLAGRSETLMKRMTSKWCDMADNTQTRCVEIVQILHNVLKQNTWPDKMKEQLRHCLLNYIVREKITSLSSQQMNTIGMMHTRAVGIMSPDAGNDKNTKSTLPLGADAEMSSLLTTWKGNHGGKNWSNKRYYSDSESFRKIMNHTTTTV